MVERISQIRRSHESTKPRKRNPRDPLRVFVFSWRIVLVGWLLIFVTSGVARATVLVPGDLGELAREARAIARGRIVAVDAQWTDGPRQSQPASGAAGRVRARRACVGRGAMTFDQSARRIFTVVVIGGILLGHVRPALAYLKFGFDINGRQVTLKWSAMPVRYFVTDQGVGGVSATEFQAAAARAFATWQAVPTAATSYV